MNDCKDKFHKLVSIIKTLRGPEGCPWDKKQTPEDVKTYLLEEVYEVIEAIDENNPVKLKEELGDLLLLIIFLADYSEDKKDFNLEQVLEAISKKLVKRHPHVFSGLKIKNPEEVIKNWDKLKQKEKKRNSFFEGIPKTAPALLKGYLFVKKALRFHKIKKVSLNRIALKVKKNADKKFDEESIGNLLFNIVEYSANSDINPETALLKYMDKYSKNILNNDT